MSCQWARRTMTQLLSYPFSRISRNDIALDYWSIAIGTHADLPNETTAGNLVMAEPTGPEAGAEGCISLQAEARSGAQSIGNDDSLTCE